MRRGILGSRAPAPLVTEHPFAPGDVLVLYTDGVTETENATGEQFGEEGLESLIHACHGCSAETIVERIREAVDRHGDGSAGDDMTLIVVRRLPVDSDEPPRAISA